MPRNRLLSRVRWHEKANAVNRDKRAIFKRVEPQQDGNAEFIDWRARLEENPVTFVVGLPSPPFAALCARGVLATFVSSTFCRHAGKWLPSACTNM